MKDNDISCSEKFFGTNSVKEIRTLVERINSTTYLLAETLDGTVQGRLFILILHIFYKAPSPEKNISVKIYDLAKMLNIDEDETERTLLILSKKGLINCIFPGK